MDKRTRYNNRTFYYKCGIISVGLRTALPIPTVFPSISQTGIFLENGAKYRISFSLLSRTLNNPPVVFPEIFHINVILRDDNSNNYFINNIRPSILHTNISPPSIDLFQDFQYDFYYNGANDQELTIDFRLSYLGNVDDFLFTYLDCVSLIKIAEPFICFSGDSLVYSKNLITDNIDYVKVKEIHSNTLIRFLIQNIKNLFQLFIIL